LQGSTIKLLVKVLDIQLSKAKECKLCADIQETVQATCQILSIVFDRCSSEPL
jgi:hypothetical protein